MTTANQMIAECDKYVMNTYGRFPICFDRGEGVWLYTVDGRKILDMSAGIAVSSLGHANPALLAAIQEQAAKLIHVSNLYYTKPFIELAKLLVENTHFAKAFFCNSGGEANEAAIKLARKYGKSHGGEDKYKILTMKNSFHGRTLATVTATGQTKYQHGFEPVMPGFDYVEFNNIDDLNAKMDKNVCAVMLEVVQGEGGIKPVTPEFFAAARKACDDNDALLIVDEVQTGIGRTGKLFAYQHYDVEPDVISMAKGIAGGLPMGGILATSKCCDTFQPGDHASTFGGNPVAAAAACVVIKTLLSDGFLKNVTDTSNYFADSVRALQKKYPVIKDVRGMGWLRGIELTIENRDVINKLIDAGVVTCPSGKNVIRFIPPLIITKDEVDFALEKLENVLK
ncbi:MAG: aspartate aminotransferase family protein [Spirochaetales bacterium]|nr:aspartate aminotransferase family protein [Spirochaetales bacterium]